MNKNTAINRLVTRLPERFRWTPHNLVAHPLMELAHLVGLSQLSGWLHDSTLPLR